MIVKTSNSYSVLCDGCGIRLPNAHDVISAKQSKMAHGWQTVFDSPGIWMDLCPGCYDKAEENGYKAFSAPDEPNEADANDNINHPSHYTFGGIECIDAIAAATSDLSGVEAVCTGNAIKYLWRWKHKNGVEDLEKARWYIDRLINEMGKGEKA